MASDQLDHPNSSRNRLSIAIQSGGRSKRMGEDKAVLEIGGHLMIERVISQVSALADELLVISNDPDNLENLGVPIIADLLPVQGVLSGFYTALTSVNSEFVAIIACDMPFANITILSRCFEVMLQSDADVGMPKSGENLFEPLHAVYRCKPCKQAVFDAIEKGEHRLISWLANVKVAYLEQDECKRLDPTGLAFFNINTHADLDRAILLINSGQNQTTAPEN